MYMVAQQVKMLAPIPDDLSFVPETHNTWWEERTDFCKFSSDPHTWAVTHAH